MRQWLWRYVVSHLALWTITLGNTDRRDSDILQENYYINPIDSIQSRFKISYLDFNAKNYRFRDVATSYRDKFPDAVPGFR